MNEYRGVIAVNRRLSIIVVNSRELKLNKSKKKKKKKKKSNPLPRQSNQTKPNTNQILNPFDQNQPYLQIWYISNNSNDIVSLSSI